MSENQDSDETPITTEPQARKVVSNNELAEIGIKVMEDLNKLTEGYTNQIPAISVVMSLVIKAGSIIHMIGNSFDEEEAQMVLESINMVNEEAKKHILHQKTADSKHPPPGIA